MDNEFFVITGCSLVNVTTDYDPAVKITQLKTFAIVDFEFGDALINNRVHGAIEKELVNKSYTLVDEDKADFLVLDTPEQRTQYTNEIVHKMLEKYPDRFNGH